MSAPTAPSTEVDAVVVGAGFSGMYALYSLRKLGFSTRVFDAGADVGGTWYWNRYPGARVDVYSLQYCYSWDDDLQQEYVWTEKYPAQPEILAYINHVADRYDLRKDITFSTKVIAAAYDETTHRWTVETDTGESVTAQFLILGSGPLSVPLKPNFPGLDSFTGEWYLTGRWPHDGVDLAGKRVGIIGTGSTGIQAIPEIAKVAEHLTVFQRTPNFTVAAQNYPLSDEEQAEQKAHYAEMRHKARTSRSGLPIDAPTQSALEVSDEERNARFEERWKDGSIATLLYSYNDLMLNEEANELVAEFIRQKMRAEVEDPEVAEMLTPRGYPFGGKRPILDTNYMKTFNRDNVTLVDVRANPIEEITPTGLRTTAAEYEFDVIVFATGFDALTGSLTSIDISGVGGEKLTDHWKDGPRTYLGLAIHGFPNMFPIVGPQSPSVLSNMVISIEHHIEWVRDLLVTMRTRGLETVEATADAEQAWTDKCAHLATLTLHSRADSWFFGANVPGKPRVFLPYLGGVGPYMAECQQVAEDGYVGFELK